MINSTLHAALLPTRDRSPAHLFYTVRKANRKFCEFTDESPPSKSWHKGKRNYNQKQQMSLIHILCPFPFGDLFIFFSTHIAGARVQKLNDQIKCWHLCVRVLTD